MFREKVKESDVEALEQQNLSATHWCTRADSTKAFWSSIYEITKVLEELEHSDDTKNRAKSEEPITWAS